MAERKVFDIYKRIPVVGVAYGAVRGFAYGLAGNEEELKHSWEMDPADLNPLRMPRNIVNGFIAASRDLDEGIWIGKRSLGNQPFGMTFIPGADGHHWCIQIDGIIYEVSGKEKEYCKIKIVSQSDEQNLYDSYCSRFSWTNIPEVSREESNSTLKEYAELFKHRKYSVRIQQNKENCQTFVRDMLAKAANITSTEAADTILNVMPNMAF